MIVEYILYPVAFILGYILGRVIKEKPIRGRLGLLKMTAKGWGGLEGVNFKNVQIVVEEIESIDNQSKIKIRKISGMPKYLHSHVKDSLNTYIPTDKIKWFSSVNSLK